MKHWGSHCSLITRGITYSWLAIEKCGCIRYHKKEGEEWGMRWGLSGPAGKMGRQRKSVSRSVSLTTSFSSNPNSWKKCKKKINKERKKERQSLIIFNSSTHSWNSFVEFIRIQNKFCLFSHVDSKILSFIYWCILCFIIALTLIWAGLHF